VADLRPIGSRVRRDGAARLLLPRALVRLDGHLRDPAHAARRHDRPGGALTAIDDTTADEGVDAIVVPRRSSLRGAATLSLAQGLFVLAGYILNVVLARYLGPGAYGVYGVVISLLTIVNLMQTQGVPQALSRAIAGGSDEAAAWRSALHVQGVASAGGFLLLALSAPILASVLDDERLLSGLLIAALAVPSYAVFATLGGVLNGRRDFVRQARMNAVYALARVVCVLGLALAFQFAGAIAGYAIAPLIAFAAVYSERPRGDGRAPFDWHALVRFALPNIGLALALTAIMSIDLLFVKGIVPDDATAGIYAAAQNAARLTYFVIIPAGLVLFPAMAEAMASGDRARQRVLVGDGIEGALAVVLVLTAVMAGARVPLLDLAFGTAYEGAATAFELLAPALGCLAMAYTLASLLTGSGHPHPPMRVAAVALGLQVIIEYPLTSRYGISGAALGTLIAAALCMVGEGFLVHRRFGSVGEVSRIARLLVAAGGAYAVASLASSRLDVLPLCFAATLVYVLLVVALRVVPRRLRRTR
jgi:O-antigen/teichoic acid export membrane protein